MAFSHEERDDATDANAGRPIDGARAPATPTVAAPPRPVRSSRWRIFAVLVAIIAILPAIVVVVRPYLPKRPPLQKAGAPRTDAKPPAEARFPFDEVQAQSLQTRWAAHLKLPVEQTNSLGMPLRLIPPGTFTRVAVWTEVVDGRAMEIEKPPQDVVLTRPFQISVHEVTVGQFRKFVIAENYQTETERDGQPTLRHAPPAGDPVADARADWKQPGFEQTDNHPVVHVSWNDADAFCKWLSKIEKCTYRLPTEAEWEYCCRAGTPLAFAWGDDEALFTPHANHADASYKKAFPTTAHPTMAADDGHAFTAPVGAYRPNAFGLYDMHGNAWEWAQDWFGKNTYAVSPLSDPAGPRAGASKILRGGSWATMPREGRCEFREPSNPATARSDQIGFRVVRVIPGS